MPKLRRLIEMGFSPNLGIPPPPPPPAEIPPAEIPPAEIPPAAGIVSKAFPFRLIIVVYLVYFVLYVLRHKIMVYIAGNPLDVCANGMIETMKIRPSINEGYVHRSLLEAFKWNSTVPTYYVLVAPKGAGLSIFDLIKLFSNCLYSIGKSTVIEAIRANADYYNIEMLHLLFSSDTTLYEQVAIKSCMQLLMHKFIASEEFVVSFVSKVVNDLASRGKALVLAVEEGIPVSSSHIAGLVTMLKIMCTRNCIVIVALSDAFDITELPLGEEHVKVMWISDFTTQEANELFDKRNFLKGDAERRAFIFQNYGTRPLTLALIADYGADYQLKLDKIDLAARIHSYSLFSASIATGGDFEKLIKLLLESPDKFEDNDPLLSFKSVKIEEVRAKLGEETVFRDIRNASAILKQYYFVIFHYPSSSYRFSSKDMERAFIRLFSQKSKEQA